MCRGEANKALAEKICELQRQICEYERFVSDLAIMLAKKEVQTVRKHDVPYPADWVWDKIRDMVNAERGIKVDSA